MASLPLDIDRVNGLERILNDANADLSSELQE